MFDHNLDYDEGIILENDSVWWESRDELELDSFVLTNKRICCEYERGNGLFKKVTKELYSFPLSDIKIVDGKALVQQVKREGSWCLLIQFRHGSEYFSFSDSPKEVIPQWIITINNTLGIPSDNNCENSEKHSKKESKQKHEHFVIGTKSTHSSTYYCSGCGASISTEANFCPSCGKKICTNSSKRNPSQDINSVTADASFEVANSKRQQEYIGKVYKCPNCGSVISRSTAICPDCGMKISTVQDSATLRAFRAKITELETKEKSDSILGVYKEIWGVFAGYKNPIVAFIKNYPIPDSVDEIVEFAIYAKTCFDSCNLRNDKYWAWQQKIKQLYMKARISFPNDAAFKEVERIYLEVMEKSGE